MNSGVFQGKKFPFTPKRRKKSLGSQCNNIIDTRHDLAAFRSKLANVPWLRSYIRVHACHNTSHALLSSLNNSFVVRSCKKVVLWLINFLCSVMFCSVAFWLVVLWCVVLFIFFVLHLCYVGSIHYQAILHERTDIAY